MAVLEFKVSSYGDNGRGLLGMSMMRFWAATKREHPSYFWIWTTRGRVLLSSTDRPSKWR